MHRMERRKQPTEPLVNRQSTPLDSYGHTLLLIRNNGLHMSNFMIFLII